MIVDLFAGAGGASCGIRAALGRDPDVAVNHSPTALAIHEANHPDTLHLAADVWEVDPRETAQGRDVELLWASPDCTHHSRAKGGKPKDSGLRSLAWVVRDWARDVRPRVIIIENVAEFLSWGPLDASGQPIKERRGETFGQWVGALDLLGYRVEWRVLAACDYGAPTSRRRLFVIARCDGEPITWPEPTHGPGLLPYRTAAECIDWSLPVPSIFDRPRPLAEATQRRIAAGLKRFITEHPDPFVAPTGSYAWVARHYGGMVGADLRQPLHTITATDHHAVCVAAPGSPTPELRAWVTAYYGAEHEAGQDLREPLRTIVGVDRFGLCVVDRIGMVGMRMMAPGELLRAQFGDFADGYDMRPAKTKKAAVKAIGNSVAPAVSYALVRAQLGDAMRRAA